MGRIKSFLILTLQIVPRVPSPWGFDGIGVNLSRPPPPTTPPMNKTDIVRSQPAAPAASTAAIAFSFLVALCADGFQLLLPPAWWLADGFACLALFCIWGFRKEILLFLIPELVPGIAIFPSWTLAILALARKRK